MDMVHMCQEKKEEDDSSALRIALIYQHKGSMITLKNSCLNISNDKREVLHKATKGKLQDSNWISFDSNTNQRHKDQLY